jgi:asparagine synthetase B (glutamine-hydrolysing)
LQPKTERGCAVEGWIEGPWPPKPDVDSLHFSSILRARGDFSFMAATEQGLFLCSGPAGGHRPIFIVAGRDWAAASTQLRVVLALLGERPRLDFDYMASSTLIHYPTEATATPYRGIDHVPLGEAWLLRPGGDKQRFSTLGNPPNDELQAADGALAQVLRNAVEEAVRRSTCGATKVGVMLSGGLDSSSVLLTLDRMRRTGRLSLPTEAFSWEFDAPEPGDDRPYRRAVEREWGRRSCPVLPEEAGEFVRRAMVLDATPCTDTPCALWIALDRAAQRRGVDRLLTGVGGDNVLEGDPTLFGALALRGQLREAARRAVGLRMASRPSTWWRLHQLILRPAVRAMFPAPLLAAYRRGAWRLGRDWMGPRLKTWMRERAGRAATPSITLDSSPAERYVALATMPFIADMAFIRAQQEEVTKCHRSDPLFDDGLLRVVASFPPLSLMSGGYLRGLFREAMSDRLPELVRTRQSKAYMEPALARMVEASGGFRQFEDLGRVRRLADLGLVEPRHFARHFQALVHRPLEAVWVGTWQPLAMEEFLRQYDEGWTS